MDKSKLLGILVVVILFAFIGVFFFLEYTEKVKRDTINEIQVEQKYKEEIKTILKNNKLQAEKEFFLSNLSNLIEINPYTSSRGLFGTDTFISINNKSEYALNEFSIYLKYMKNGAIIYTELIEFPYLKGYEILKMKIPHHRCGGWEWDVYKIKCNELKLDFTNENI